MNKGILLRQLEPFRNNSRLIEANQDVKDIINGMLEAHKKFSSEYDKICHFFKASSPKETAKKIFDFLKENVKYKIEPESRQTLKSPSAIITLGNSIGSDCKCYSLFIGGVLDALKRSGENIKWCYRFASYKMFDKNPHHVFVVLNPNTTNEIWIDPVLHSFNEKKNFNYKIDKNMALYTVSGVGNQTAPKSGGGFVPSSDLISTGLSLITSLFEFKPNPNDWKGWDAMDRKLGYSDGAQAAYWVVNNGDSPANEAGNIVSYIKNIPQGFDKMLSHAKDWNLNTSEFLDLFYNKMNNNNFQSVVNVAKGNNVTSTASNLIDKFFPNNNNQNFDNSSSQQSGNNNLLMYAGIGLIAYLILKK
jgi:hypothetical protein